MPGAGPGGADGAPLLEFADVMRRLRAECPWKAAQSHRSLARYLLEETHEVLEALDGLADPGPTGPGPATDHLREELGDLLLQVFLHTAIAEEAGAFTLDEVARDGTAKMVRRNPHVFTPPGQAPADRMDAAEVNDAWQEIKAQEKGRTGPTEGIPPTLPALLYADKVLDRLERGGVPVTPDPDGTLGDRLLALVAEARASGVDPEQALRDTVRRLVAAPPGEP